MKTLFLSGLLFLVLQQKTPLYEEYILFGKTIVEVKEILSQHRELEFVMHDSTRSLSPNFKRMFFQHRLTYKLHKSDHRVAIVFDMNRHAMVTSVEVDSMEAKHIFVVLNKEHERMAESSFMSWKWGPAGYVALTRKPGKSTSELYYNRGGVAVY